MFQKLICHRNDGRDDSREQKQRKLLLADDRVLINLSKMSWQTNQLERDLEKIIELTFTKLFLENVLYNYMYRRTSSVSRRMYEWERNADIRLSFLLFFFFLFFFFFFFFKRDTKFVLWSYGVIRMTPFSRNEIGFAAFLDDREIYFE